MFGAGFVFSELPVTPIVIALSVAAIIGASTVAIFQTNLKRMFAYSSVGQIGYITLGLALASVTGLTGGIVHLLNHAMVKAAIFMGLGAVFFRVSSVIADDVAGIGRRMPLTIAAVVIAGFSLIGVPGTAGFVSKWLLIVASLEAGLWWLGFFIVLSSMLTVVYVGRLIEVAWFRQPTGQVAKAEEAPIEMLLPLWIFALATVYSGIDTEFTAGLSEQAADVLLGGLR